MLALKGKSFSIRNATAKRILGGEMRERYNEFLKNFIFFLRNYLTTLFFPKGKLNRRA